MSNVFLELAVWGAPIVPDSKAIERATLADRERPCLFHVAGPCMHPKCLEAHYETIKKQTRTMP